MSASASLRQWLEQLPFRGKFGRDVFWNYVSLAVVGVSGIFMSVVIARTYGAAALGVFNQVFTIYIFLSQVAVVGVHFSVLKHVAQFQGDRQSCDRIITAGIAMTAFMAGIICILIFALRGWIGDILNSPGVSVGIGYALPGIWCFTLNKVLISVLNGYRRMKAFAFFQALRFVLIIGFLAILAVMGAPSLMLPLIFTASEIVLTICLAAYVLTFYSPISFRQCLGWVMRHAVFSFKGGASTILTDANTRVDVIMLGYFANDKVVGIYSLAAMMVEGISQLTIVLRSNVNPVITRLISTGQWDELKKMVRRGVRMTYCAIGVVGILSVFFYPVFVRCVVRRPDFIASSPVFTILMGGLLLGIGYKPFSMILIQSGNPGFQTILLAMIVTSNIVLNIFLIPLLGMYGAAIATGLSFVLGVFFLKMMVGYSLKIRI